MITRCASAEETAPTPNTNAINIMVMDRFIVFLLSLLPGSTGWRPDRLQAPTAVFTIVSLDSFEKKPIDAHPHGKRSSSEFPQQSAPVFALAGRTNQRLQPFNPLLEVSIKSVV